MLSQEERVKLYRHLDDLVDQLVIDAEGIAHRTLPFIHRGIRNHTAHGWFHSKAVLNIINELIDLMDKKPSQCEIRLLYIAAWLHDIGNLRSRKHHSEMSCQMIDKLDDHYIQLGLMKTPLKFVVKYHQSKFDLSKVPDEPYCSYPEPIRLPFLCALFRLADGCHMGEDRAYRVIYYLIGDRFNDVSREHWEANNLVTAVYFDKNERKIVIIVEKVMATKILTTPFIKEFQTIKPYLENIIPLDGVEIIKQPRFK